VILPLSFTLAGWLQIRIKHRAPSHSGLVYFCNHWAMATTLSEKRVSSSGNWSACISVQTLAPPDWSGWITHCEDQSTPTPDRFWWLDTFSDVTGELRVYFQSSTTLDRGEHQKGSDLECAPDMTKDHKKGYYSLSSSFCFSSVFGYHAFSVWSSSLDTRAPFAGSGNSRQLHWGWSTSAYCKQLNTTKEAPPPVGSAPPSM
jgi:hypothetical protein